MPSRKIILAASLCLCLFQFQYSPAYSAPFCVEGESIPAECWYYDIRACKEEAAKRKGYCSVNHEEISLPETGAPFCMIDSAMIPVCAYQNGETCHMQASAKNAVCFQNISNTNIDPFRFDRLRSQYE